MITRIKLTVCFLILFIACKEDVVQVTACNENLFNANLNYNYEQFIRALPDYVVTGLTKNPSPAGALGRNMDGYFHVRFQLDMGYLAAYAIRFASNDALDKFVLACEYSFSHQKPGGDFELVIPENLKALGEPSEGDLTSGTSFFMGTLGSSLMALEQSAWFNDQAAVSLIQRLSELEDDIQLSINYLKSKKELLKSYDNDAPNRLFYDALAFYSLGKYLNDQQSISIRTRIYRTRPLQTK